MKKEIYLFQQINKSSCRKHFLVVLFGLSALLGCQSTLVYPPPSEAVMNTSKSPSAGLQPGDEIEIKFFYTPELDIEQTVRPDGKIQLQLIGDVDVNGKTPNELREELLDFYRSHLKDPELAVIVRSTEQQRVYVGGQVNRPGVVEMPGQLTLLEAIMEGGGFDRETAELENVVVIRHKDNKRQGYSVNVKTMLEGNEVSPPFYLQPQDIIYVPQTEIVKLDQWINQYINTFVPNTAGFFYTVPIGEGTIGLRND